MRCMERNKTGFWYALFDREEPIRDEDGRKTSETEILYKNPVFACVNVSPPNGSVSIRKFGLKEDYDRILVYEKGKLPLEETSVLWIDREPEIKQDGSTETPWDYVVKKVAPSLNSVIVGVSKVSVGE